MRNDCYNLDYDFMDWNEQDNDINKIGDSGACSIGEGLKVNSTLTTITINGF